ncbi:type VI secretion system baseplate subunit TssG [Halomonas campisalis]|uniref:Type VI secretion system baseplate subunit TssG n=1 Tax=Billgrantia campisalis TaxID=74661 RepID=A0ABS9P6V8_9GAMM|nr:type VI secretion system baseplate subunit TssG [Halomonas campisalis]MCG6657489.1 type VI secretion system baseplate subunit TssG [Halomonas campisalis]MDR5863164.1 type VI secretion system baseplate subunit TssG [Halomonas campisalis]
MTLPRPLMEAPERFTLFAALRWVEASAPDRARLGRSRRVAEDAVRLAQMPSLRFAPGEITHIEPGEVPRIHAEGFGLLGPNGPLPLHLTEYADERRRLHQDPSFADFLNLFHHRLASLFYRAWAEASPAVEADRPDNRFFEYLGALAGLGTPGLLGRDRVDDRAKLHRVGRFAALTRCQEGLEDILEDHLGVAVRVEPFQARWLTIPDHERLCLGTGSPVGRLGRDASLGGRSWQCQFSFRIVLESLTREQYDDYLPGQPGLLELGDLVRGYVGDELGWDLELNLKPRQAPLLRLSRGQRLGMSTWLGRRSHHKAARALVRDAHRRRGASRRGPESPGRGE